MEDKKVFGYPEFDSQGEMVLTSYTGAYRDMLMDIREYRREEGDLCAFLSHDEETAILLLSGEILLIWEGKQQICSRKDVFTEGPWCLHVPKGVEVVVEPTDGYGEYLVQKTHNDRVFPSKLYSPEDAPWKDVCRGKFGDTANRRVNTIFDYNNAPYSNMVLGEVLNDKGNWSGYIPHSHPQPETYFFLFDRPEGFGASFVGDEVYKSTHRSFSAIPGGLTHPQVCAPGYTMYTCWMIRHLDGNPWTDRIDDERYTWLYDFS
ncbi:5-deoxy-glucuronate isomerase [Clostridia bacterium]|nr:5-deoxy-glucuronate isomerase [Clostridia bacterium]